MYRAISEASPLFGVGGWREANLRERIEAATKIEHRPHADQDNDHSL